MSHCMVTGVSRGKKLYVRKQNSGRSQRRIHAFKLERRPFDAGFCKCIKYPEVFVNIE